MHALNDQKYNYHRSCLFRTLYMLNVYVVWKNINMMMNFIPEPIQWREAPFSGREPGARVTNPAQR